MARILVRDIDDDIVEQLRSRAAQNGRSIEEEIRIILRNALPAEQDEDAESGGFGTESAALFRSLGLPDGTIREMRGVPFTTRPLPFGDDGD